MNTIHAALNAAAQIMSLTPAYTTPEEDAAEAAFLARCELAMLDELWARTLIVEHSAD